MEEETSAHILCECEVLVSLSFFLEPQDIQIINLGAIRDFSKVTGSQDLTWGTKDLSIRPRCIGFRMGSRTQVKLIIQSKAYCSDNKLICLKKTKKTRIMLRLY